MYISIGTCLSSIPSPVIFVINSGLILSKSSFTIYLYVSIISSFPTYICKSYNNILTSITFFFLNKCVCYFLSIYTLILDSPSFKSNPFGIISFILTLFITVPWLYTLDLHLICNSISELYTLFYLHFFVYQD